GWEFIQKCWRDGEATPKNLAEFLNEFDTADLGEAFGTSIHQADTLADRLRSETSRVNEKKRLLAIRKQLEAERPEWDQRIANCQTELEQVEQEWQKLWHPLGIQPGTPSEMQEWRQAHMSLMTTAKNLHPQRMHLQGLEERIEEHRAQLVSCLESIGAAQELSSKSLAELVEQSQNVLDEMTQRQDQQARLQEEIEKAQKTIPRCEHEIQTAEEELAAWQTQWAVLMEKLGLSTDATANQANAILDTLGQLFGNLREESVLAGRVRAMRDFNTQFEDRVNALVQALNWKTKDLPPIQIVNNLHAELTRTREAAHKLRDVQEEFDRQKQALENHERIIQLAEAEQQQMCVDAGCDHPDQLPQAEKNSARRQELQQDRNELREQIIIDAADASFEEFLKEADAEDTDALSGRLAELDHQVSEVENAS
ncbi:MAG: hypothetical protein KDA84_29645, partial [Planctomycetaceae bacterium]|nr:hypothetical protein [Planctomycetaceae bacterium]